MNASIKIKHKYQKDSAIEESHKFLIEEGCTLVESCNNYPYTEKDHTTKHRINLAVINLVCVFHAIHYDVVHPEGHYSVEMIRRPSEIKTAAISYNYLAEPEGSTIFVHEFQACQHIISHTCDYSTFKSEKTICGEIQKLHQKHGCLRSH